jgi:integrase
MRDLAMFNLAVDSKLRGCDVVALKVEDIAPHGYVVDRATVRQKKTGQPVRFEVTEQTRQAVDNYIRKIAPKYRSKKNPKLTWAGRGATPVWMRDEMRGTKLKKENFLLPLDGCCRPAVYPKSRVVLS